MTKTNSNGIASCRYSFAKSHKVLLIDEFDFIEQELLKFRAFRPANFRARVQYLAETYPTVWTVKVENGKLERTGELKDHDRARGVAELSSRFAHVLPDLEMVYNGHDGARIALAYEERHRLELLAKAHQCTFLIDQADLRWTDSITFCR